MMGGDSFGHCFKINTCGESHGHSMGVIITGVPKGTAISRSYIQKELDRRRPGQSPLTSSRNEPDKLEIIGGIIDDMATGEPIELRVLNIDKRPRDYDKIINKPRPGHADMTYFQKYGKIPVGGGRASGRETVSRVLAGAIAKQILLTEGIEINGRIIEVGGSQDIENRILEARENADSVGGLVEIIARNVPPGLGEPVFDKLDADIAKALMSIGSVKGVEFGAGFRVSGMTGSENNDSIILIDNKLATTTNNSGGILGGISNGMPIICRIAVKPTPSIAMEQETVDIEIMEPSKIRISGRHDPCICQRILPVAESMLAIVLVDHLWRSRS